MSSGHPFASGAGGARCTWALSSPWPGAWLLRGQVRSLSGLDAPSRSALLAEAIAGRLRRCAARASPSANSVDLATRPSVGVADLVEAGGVLESATARLQLVVLAGQAMSAARGEYPRCRDGSDAASARGKVAFPSASGLTSVVVSCTLWSRRKFAILCGRQAAHRHRLLQPTIGIPRALAVKILYASQYFPPEMGAPAARVHELSREWVRLGHHVTVLTGFPKPPDRQ